MQVNADLSTRAVVTPRPEAWVSSPADGVERLMLDRDGDEVARATSLVRFAPNSRFARHTHGGGEEFLVLEGTFADEAGRYPAGTYVRNPIGTSHAPWSDEGAVLFVKLRQFAADDAASVVVDTNDDAGWRPLKPGVERLALHRHGDEEVMLLRLAPGGAVGHHDHPRGEEVLVLRGTLRDEHGTYPTGTWLRNPPGSAHAPYSEDGCIVYVKRGHLGTVDGG